MELKEQLVIWKKADFLLDHMAWSGRLQDALVDEGLLDLKMVNDIHSYRYDVERKLRFLTLLGSRRHNPHPDVYQKFLRALETAGHDLLVKDIQRTYRLIKFGEMLPPSFTYFMDLSEFFRTYPHIAIKLGEDGKHLLQSFIEGKIDIEIRKHMEHLKTLETTNIRLEEEMKAMEARMAAAREAQLAAEALWATSGGKIDELKHRINELEASNRDYLREIRHMKHFYKIHADLEDVLEEEYAEHAPLVAASIPGSELESARSTNRKRVISETERQKYQLLQSQVGLNMVRLDLIRTSIQNLNREEKRVQDVSDCIAQAKPGEIADDLVKEVDSFLGEIQKTKEQLEKQLDDGEVELHLHEKELADREKEHDIPAEITVWTHTDLVAKLKATIENIKRDHVRKMREQKLKHERDMDEMIERIQKINEKHSEEVEKLRATIRKKMLEIHKREQLHKKLRGQIRVMENYQSRNMNATVPVETCRKIVRAMIGEARILRDIADEKDVAVSLADEEAARMDRIEKKEKGDKKGKGKKGKKKKKKMPESLNEERIRYIADKIKTNWRGMGKLLGLTDNRLDIVEMDAGGNAERLAYCMLRVWRDEEHGTPADIALALLEAGMPQLSTLFLPMSKLVALKQARDNPKDPLADVDDGEDGDGDPNLAPNVSSSIPTLPPISVA